MLHSESHDTLLAVEINGNIATHKNYITTNITAAFAVYRLEGLRQYKLYWLCSTSMNINSGAVWNLSLTISEKKKSHCYGDAWKEREEEGRSTCFCFLCLCQPRATIMLVNRNIFLVRKGASLSCVYISCRIAWSLFLSRAAGLRNAHIRRAV